MANLLDLTGQQFTRLTVIKRAENTPQNRAQWLCLCECGNEKVVQSIYLTKGTTRSCGCLGNEQRKANASRSSRADSTRKMSPTRRSWEAMIRRCTDQRMPNFHKYGGRGITVCEQWLNSFAAFLSDMGEKPEGRSLDRIDNQGNYTSDNCRWATAREQSNNHRSNRLLTHSGRTMTVAQWSREIGISQNTLHQRIRRGWKVERILSDHGSHR